MLYADSASGRLAYDDLGQGEPTLLLLPGWCTNRTCFTPITSLLAANRRCLSMDWRGHGDSARPAGDFGQAELVDDAMAVIRASRAERVVPVAMSHAGFVAMELQKRLGTRVPGIVLIDWMVFDPPVAFMETLKRLQLAQTWEKALQELMTTWRAGGQNVALTRFLRREVGSYQRAMWNRAAREISAGYAHGHTPMQTLLQLNPPLPVLHLYAQPDDPAYLAAQLTFARDYPWFHVRRLQARSHFPMFEAPAEMAAAIEGFVATLGRLIRSG